MRSHELATLVQWLEKAGIADFEMKEPGRFIRVVMQRRHGQAGPAHGGSAAFPERGSHRVTADAGGIFMAAHPLRAKPLTEVGSSVAAGDVLGVVQVGEVLYRPVLAGHQGRVSRRWVTDGERIEEGMPLFEIAAGSD